MAYGTNAPFGLRPISSINGGSWTEKQSEYYISSTTANGITTGYASPIFQGDPVIFNPSATAPAAGYGTGWLATAGTIAVYAPGFTDGTPSTFAGGTQPILGVFMECEYQSSMTATNNLIKSPYWPGAAQIVPGSLIKAYVLDDPDVLYDVQLSTHVDATANNFNGLAPCLPVYNPAGANAAATLAGSFGSLFALNIGGGTNFSTIQNTTTGDNLGYANNPTTGNTLTGQSAFYVDVCTTVGGLLTHDYAKTTATLPFKALYYTRDVSNEARLNPAQAVAPFDVYHTPFLNVTGILNNTVARAGARAVTFA